jgi:hypothetical protein
LTTLVRRRSSRVVLVAGLLVVLVIAGIVLVARRGSEDLRVVEIGFSEVVEADDLTARSAGDEGRPLVSWAAVIENTTADRLAYAVHLRVELVDDSGDVITEATPIVDVLPPNQLTAVTGFTDERTSDVADVHVEIEETERWDETSEAAGITTEDLEVAYAAENQPIVTFTATSNFTTRVGERSIHVVGRNRDGRIVTGWTTTSLLTDPPPLEPGQPAPGAAWPHFAVPDLATVEVYIEPVDLAS